MSEQRVVWPEDTAMFEAGSGLETRAELMVEPFDFDSWHISDAAESVRTVHALSEADRPRMEEAGFEWPGDEHKVSQRLAELNACLRIGNILQSTRPDFNATAVYKARKQFYGAFPVLGAAHAVYERYWPRTVGHGVRRSPVLPGNVVSVCRLYQERGIELGARYKRWPLDLTAKPEVVEQSLSLLASRGLDSTMLANNGVTLGLHESKYVEKFRVLDALMRAVDPDGYKERVNRLIEQYPQVLSQGRQRLRVVGRIALERFGRGTSPVDVASMSFEGVGQLVAAHLGSSRDLSTPYRLKWHARLLRESYTASELRGYIATYADDHLTRYVNERIDAQLERMPDMHYDEARETLRREAMHTLDPVVRQYLSGYPICGEEAKRLPKLHSLPKRDEVERTIYEGFDEPEAHRTYVRASDRKQYIDYLQHMKYDPSPTELFSMLKAIRAGETEPLKQLMVAYGARLITPGEDGRRPMINPAYEDALSSGLLRLGMAIMDLAKCEEHEWPGDGWEFIEQWIRNGGIFRAQATEGLAVEPAVAAEKGTDDDTDEARTAHSSLSDFLKIHSPRGEGVLSYDQAAAILDKLRATAGK